MVTLNALIKHPSALRAALLASHVRPRLRSGKPHVMLVVDTRGWAFHTFAEKIMEAFTSEYSFTLFFKDEIKSPSGMSRFISALWNTDVVVDFRAIPEYYSLLRALKIKVVSNIAHLNDSNDCSAVAQAHMIISNCNESQRELSEWCGVFPLRIVRVDLGVDTQFFSRKDASALRKKIGVPPGSMVLGFFVKPSLGRKGEEDFLSALEQVKKTLNPFVVLLGKNTHALEARLTEKGIPFHSAFVAFEELPLYYSLLDAYVITSLKEGGPLTAMEALACEVPLISTRVGVLPEFLSHGSDVLFIRKQHSKDLVAALKKVHTSKSVARSLSQKGRKAVARMDWSAIMKRAAPAIHQAFDPHYFGPNPRSDIHSDKLEIGSGSNPMTGFIHLDARALDQTDVVGNVVPTLPFPSNTFSEVRSRHTIEHFPRKQVPLVLKEWSRVLKKGGLLVVEFPDVRAISLAHEKGDIPTEEFSRLLYGDQDHAYNFHMAGFDGPAMGRILEELGMKVVSIEPAEMILPGRPKWGAKVTARKL